MMKAAIMTPLCNATAKRRARAKYYVEARRDANYKRVQPRVDRAGGGSDCSTRVCLLRGAALPDARRPSDY